MESIRSKMINTLLIVDIGIVLFCYLAGQRDWFLNSQIAYLSSIIIVLASMYSYAKMVKIGVENEVVTTSNDDLLEKLEDPHGLYDDSHIEQGLESKNDETMKQAERDNEKEEKISTMEAMKKNKAYISFHRIGAYAILVLGFLYLQNIKIFHMPSYMFGLFLPPALIAVIFYWSSKISMDNNASN